jgi:hypothetical protein
MNRVIGVHLAADSHRVEAGTDELIRYRRVRSRVPRRPDGDNVPRWTLSSPTVAVLDCFLVVGLLGLYLKFAMMGDYWGAVARFMGKAQIEDLTLADRVGFFTNDLVLNLLVVPVVATAIVARLFGAHCVVAAVVMSVVTSLGYFVELRAQDALGQYLSRDVVRDIVGWAASNPWSVRDYVSTASLLKLLALVATLLAIALVARLTRRAEHEPELGRAGLYRAFLTFPAAALIGGALFCAPICYAYQSRNALLNTSSVGRAATLLAGSDSQLAPSGQSFDEALAVSARLTGTSRLDAAHTLVGHERDSDVIVFVMETGTARALDIASVGRDLPGAGPLFDRAFVGERHYTTHPYSSDALYSMISGMYPQGRRRVIRQARPGSLNGLMSAAARNFPVRRVYVPSLYQLELDDQMYEALGAELVYASDEHVQDSFRAIGQRRADQHLATDPSSTALTGRSRVLFHDRLVGDYQAMEKMKSDIGAAISARRRYCAIFFPEVGHAPWIPLTSDPSVRARVRALMLLQDRWLKEIVDEVRRAGRLKKTIIAVTGDHGIRTQVEDPALVPGTISDYMFRVPLLVYAPQTLSRTFVVSHPTSHVDFAPTLLGLLGVAEPAARMQGVPIWQRKSSDRLYLLAFAYGGADGFVQDGMYYMRQALSGGVSRSPDFTFEEDDRVGLDDGIVPFVNGALADLDAVQRTLFARQLDPIPVSRRE